MPYKKTGSMADDMREHLLGSGMADKAGSELKSRRSKVDQAIAEAMGEPAPVAKSEPKRKK